MEVIEDILDAETEFDDVVLSVGSFDGVHRGHRRILREVIETAAREGGLPAVLTLRPHPRQVFSPEHPTNLLTTHQQKLRLFEESGIEVTFVLRFDAETAALGPLDFLDRVICRGCRAKRLVIGHDFRFGQGAQGDYDFLEAHAGRFGFEVRQVPPLFIEGERVSSTLIREQVLQGDLERVTMFLGRPYALVGPVVPGHGIGAALGFPTANIQPENAAIPAHGVYAAQAVLDGTRHAAAVNIGIAPTIRQRDITVEAHILDFHEDIAGRLVEVVFLKHLRPERKFPTRKALTDQIREDILQVKAFFDSDSSFLETR